MVNPLKVNVPLLLIVDDAVDIVIVPPVGPNVTPPLMVNVFATE
jgi:hypothetical protein